MKVNPHLHSYFVVGPIEWVDLCRPEVVQFSLDEGTVMLRVEAVNRSHARRVAEAYVKNFKASYAWRVNEEVEA